MKLLSKHYKLYLYVALPLFIVVAIGYYFFLLSIITNKADESLREDKAHIIAQLEKTEKIMDLYLDMSDDYMLKMSSRQTSIKDQFSTVMIYDPLEEEEEPYRQLFCAIAVKDSYYELTIRKSMVEYNSIMYSILLLGVVFSVMLSLGFVLLNRFLTRRLWSPFYKTVGVLSSYSPDLKQRLTLPKSHIEEFQLLNATVMRMSEKIRTDFEKQKKFIDHVAHEVQTPISVVNANMENMLQSKQLTAEDYQSLENISESTTKLSKVVKSLLLLSRIENDQYEERESIDLMKLIQKHLERNSDQLENKAITVNDEAAGEFVQKMNPVLAEILVANLLQNAIRHSAENGRIWLSASNKSDQAQLIMANLGTQTVRDPESMFEIFRKGSKTAESMGIGLSIVKEICARYGLSIQYEVEGLKHVFKIEKRKV